MKKDFHIYYLISFLIALYSGCNGQCINCSTVVSSNSVSNYSITTGNVLCIAPNFTYTGNLYLQGGTLCNEGNISKLHFYSGTFNNYGTLSTPSGTDIAIDIIGKLKINNYSGAKFIVNENLFLGSTTNDSLYINIHEGAALSVGSNFTLTGTKSKISVGLAATSPTDNTFITSLNVNGDFVLDGCTAMQLYKNIQFNVTGNTTIQNAGSKAITNEGSVTLLGDLIISGDGESSTIVTINNFSDFSVEGYFDCTMYNGDVVLNNFESPNSIMWLNNSVNISTTSFTLNNSSDLEALGTVTLNSGYLLNNDYLSAENINVAGAGILTNSALLWLSGDLYISSPDAIFKNDSITIIQKNCTNTGTMNLGQKSVLRSDNFENLSTGYIFGPLDITDSDYYLNDTVNYARIFIDNSSSNSGKISGYVMVLDATYEGHEDVHFDTKEGEFEEGENVISKDPPCYLYDLPMGFLRGRRSNTDGDERLPVWRTSFCPGEDVMIQFTSYLTITSGPTWSVTGGGFSGMTTGVSSITLTSVASDFTVYVSGTYLIGPGKYCDFISQLVFPVGTGQINTTSPLYFGVGNPLLLTSTVALGTSPYQFTWTPNVFFGSGSNHIEDPMIIPQVSMVYTVYMTDAHGCAASNTVMIIAQPFALLEKNLNGKYYNLYENQLFFKYDGQYAATNLKYNVYDNLHMVVASSPTTSAAPDLININTVNPGDNRYTLNTTSLPTGAYVLEIVNEKKEKLYLRFLKI